MDLKKPGNRDRRSSPLPKATCLAASRCIANLSDAIRRGLIASCHDSSDGGLATAVAEMCIASGLGADIRFEDEAAAFQEALATYIIEFDAEHLGELTALLGPALNECGSVTLEPCLTMVWTEKTRRYRLLSWPAHGAARSIGSG